MVVKLKPQKQTAERQVSRSVPIGTLSWYLKYRPKTISELDQDNVKQSLLSFIKSGRIPHALLFAGPKGTGKTSAARIIAKILNCAKGSEMLAEPCNACESCRSIISGSSLSIYWSLYL